MANKLARILWAMLARGEAYRAAVSGNPAPQDQKLPRAARANVEVIT